jgi:hypothetical protein
MASECVGAGKGKGMYEAKYSMEGRVGEVHRSHDNCESSNENV